jgi:hypothetical protein
MVWVDPGLPAGQGSAAYQEKGAVSDRPRNGGSRFWLTGPMFRSRSGSASSPCSDRRLTAVVVSTPIDGDPTTRVRGVVFFSAAAPLL